MGRAPGPISGPIWLLGMMGAGKSSVGRALAARLGLPFLDTDAEIERVAGCSVSEIFRREGEARFREREREAVRGALGRRAVVALGGGAVAQPAVAALLHESGVSVYLRASPEALAQRLGDAGSRPLLAGRDAAGRLARLRELLAEREAAYAAAEIVVDTDALAPAAVVERVAERIAAREQGRA